MEPDRESTPRRRLAAGERRELVLAAARACFGRSGYERTTIAEIAAAAGVTKPIVYRHFGSKQELYLALLAKHRDDLPSFLDGVGIDSGPAEQAMRPVFDRWFDYVAANSHAWEMLFRDSSGDDEIKAFRLAVAKRAQDVLAELIRSTGPGIGIAAVEPTAEMLRSGLAGLALWSIDHPEVDHSILIDVALRMSAPAFRPASIPDASDV